jgi:hypothetical protein
MYGYSEVLVIIELEIFSPCSSAKFNPKLAFDQLEKIQKKENNLDEVKEKISELDILIKKLKDKSQRLLDLYLDGGRGAGTAERS